MHIGWHGFEFRVEVRIKLNFPAHFSIMRCTTYAVKSICGANHVCNWLLGSPIQGAACVTQSSVCAPAPAGPGGRVKGLPVWRLPHLSPMNSPVRRLQWTHRRTVTYPQDRKRVG